MLQNALGMCFIAFLLQTVALPSGRVATVFLVTLFCYDVFMVFITPLFMPRGDSVMVRVATGGDMNEVRNPLPLPPFTPPCIQHGNSRSDRQTCLDPGVTHCVTAAVQSRMHEETSV